MQENSHANVVVAGATHRDLERAALRDLVALSAQCADDEAQIEQRGESALGRQHEAFKKASAQIADGYDKLDAEIRQKYAERLAAIEQRFKADTQRFEDSFASARRRATREKEAVEGDVKAQRTQALWLADSLLEGAQTKFREQTKESKDEYGRQFESVDDLEKRARGLLAKYGRCAAGLRLDEAGSEAAGGPEAGGALPSFAAECDAAERRLETLGGLRVPGLLVGVWPYVVGGLLCLVVAGGTELIAGLGQPHWLAVGIALALTVVALISAGWALSAIGRTQVRQACLPLSAALIAARQAAARELAAAEAVHREEYLAAQEKHRAERQATDARLGPILVQARDRYEAAVRSLQSDSERQSAAIVASRDRRRAKADDQLRQYLDDIRRRREADLRAAQETHDRRLAEIEAAHAGEQADLERRWAAGLAAIGAPMARSAGGADGPLFADWSDPRWDRWTPPKEFPTVIRFGEFTVDLKQITDKAPRRLTLPDRFSVPALLTFPRQSSLLIHTDHDGRAEAVRTLQMVMLRLLTGVPPGRVRFTILDPVGLGQNFAGFMHLADHDETLVGSRIWTERDHIERQLADLTEHMETVIQKYLRNEFATIDEYNAQAGELAEPYRFLVVADFPTGFDSEVFRRLASIASAGARCGVYVLILRDLRQALPADAHLEELEAHSVNLVRQSGRFVWKDEVFRQFPLTLDAPPDEQFLTRILDVVGRAARDSKRVEVPFSTIAPSGDEVWSASSRDGLTVPIGRSGATRNQTLRLGRGVAQHALIAGKTGSGKSNLLHVIITNAALWYAPDELEFYLVDFKKGVEFKTFATHALPHARAVAVESDREFGFSVLQRVDAELTRRGAMFRELGVQDLPSYRAASGKDFKLPRTLLIIDEFQEFFSEDDRLSQDSALLLDRLVRQGRAFGVHVILGSQTIGGTSGLSRSTIGQMAVRVALQCSEADSQLILGDDNSAARLLSRPGEAIYNDAGGLVEGNSPFQVAYLPDEQEDGYLARIQAAAGERGLAPAPPIVFEGNAPAAIVKNPKLMRLLAEAAWPKTCPAPLGWLGEPVAIRDPAAVVFRRQSGSNVLVIGQQEESAMAVVISTMISLAAQQPPAAARFVIFDGTGADSPLRGTLHRVAEALPHSAEHVEWRAVPEALNELAEEMQRRQAADHPAEQSIYVVLYGLQRYRVLRRQEDDFSMGFGKGEEAPKPRPDKQFADLLREGPALGIHVLAWSDTPISVERTLDRNSMREFDNRVLFQMSAADSSNLIDSPLANKLGFHRALAYSEELGVLEKLRPYALPSAEWLDYVRQRLAGRAKA